MRVRLLLDDANMQRARSDRSPLLDAHPNIELRLYNPFVEPRLARGSASSATSSALNRRMHNKSFTVDNQVDDRRRPQHRRRVLRGRRDAELRRPRRPRRRRRGAARCRPSSTSTGTAPSAYPARLIVEREPARRPRPSSRSAAQAISDDAAASRLRRSDRAARPQAQACWTGRLHVRMDDRAGRPRRPGEDARADRARPSCSCCRSCMRRFGSADEGARPGVAVLRARRRSAPRRSSRWPSAACGCGS